MNTNYGVRGLQRPSGFLLFSLLLILLAAPGCDRAVNRAAERRIRDALPELLGSARQYRVHVSGSALRTMQGRLADIQVEGDDVQIASGLLLDHLHLDLRGVDYDTARHRLKRIDSAQFAARIGQNSLDVFLAGEAPQGETLKHLEVTLNGLNTVTISGKRLVLGLEAPFEISGPLRVAGPKRVEIDAQRLKVIGLPITGIVLNFLKSKFESSMDLSALPFPIRLTTVSTEKGELNLTGIAEVGPLLERLNGGKQ